MLPPDVTPILETYFDAHNSKSAHALIIALLVSVTGASSVIATYMEGFRRANDLPMDCWTIWGRRARAYALVPLSLVPLAIASTLVVFGHFFTLWLALHVMPSVRTEVYIFAIAIRWLVALTGSVGVIALIYHMGTPIRQPWRRSNSWVAATGMVVFSPRLGFGWYVARFLPATAQVYGSLGGPELRCSSGCI